MKKGFTLIELLVVVLIIGVLSALAIPQYQKAVDKARYAELQVLVTALKNAQEVYYLANGSYATDFSQLDMDFSGYQVNSGISGMLNKEDYYVTVAESGTSGIVYGKYIPAQLLYLVYLQNSPTPNQRQCRTHAANASRGEGVCLALNGVYKSVGPFDGKIYDLP